MPHPRPDRRAVLAAAAAALARPAAAQTEAAARAGLILRPLVGNAYREAALGGEAALRAPWDRRPCKE